MPRLLELGHELMASRRLNSFVHQITPLRREAKVTRAPLDGRDANVFAGWIGFRFLVVALGGFCLADEGPIGFSDRPTRIQKIPGVRFLGSAPFQFDPAGNRNDLGTIHQLHVRSAPRTEGAPDTLPHRDNSRHRRCNCRYCTCTNIGRLGSRRHRREVGTFAPTNYSHHPGDVPRLLRIRRRSREYDFWRTR